MMKASSYRRVLSGLGAAIALSLHAAGCGAAELPKLHAEAPYFKDANGRVVLLRGVNVATDAKLPPFTIIEKAQELDILASAGMNVLRLSFIWEAFEPSPGQYNQAYLDHYAQIIDWAAERGMYVVVNFHQDGFSRYAVKGCGDGFPQWAMPEGIPLATPDNSPKGCQNWGQLLVTDQTLKQTWSGFYADSRGALTRYRAMVTRVVGQLKGRSNVVGYDVMNEPGGTTEELSAMYRDIGATIRRTDPDAVLFFVPPPLSSSGLTLDKIQDPGFRNAAFGPHFYDPAVFIARAWLGTPSAWFLNPMLQRAKDRNWTMLLGEFGMDDGSLFGKAFIKQLYDWLDVNFVSGTQWGYSPRWNPVTLGGWNGDNSSIVVDGQFRTNIYEPRAFARVTAGTPVAFKPGSRGFTYSWKHEPRLGDTVIHLPAKMRELAFVKVTPSSASCALKGTELRCTSARQEAVSVTLSY